MLCPLRKEELSRYLSCYLKADYNNGCTVHNSSRKRRQRILPVSAVDGIYTAGGLEVPEVAINNQVARVHMERLSPRGRLK